MGISCHGQGRYPPWKGRPGCLGIIFSPELDLGILLILPLSMSNLTSRMGFPEKWFQPRYLPLKPGGK